MVYLKRFCCCENVRSGSIGCAIFYIVAYIIQAITAIVAMVQINSFSSSSKDDYGAEYISYHSISVCLILCLLAIVVSGLLLYGATTDKPVHFLPWIFLACTECVLSFIVTLGCLYFMIALTLYILAIGIIIGLFGIALKIYIFLCVFSRYLELMMHSPSNTMKYALHENVPDTVLIVQ